MPISVAVLTETAEGERRVALDPAGANKLAGKNLRVKVQRGAGSRAGFSDAQYSDCELADDRGTILADADVWLWVQPPQTADIERAKPGALGLGLAFAQMAIRAHGGEIRVSDIDGGGSDFSFWIPG